MAITRHKRENLTVNDRIKVNNQVSRDEIVPNLESVTFPVNIRVDNHIRKQVTAFINLGIEKNMKALIQHMIEKEKEDLDSSQLPRFEKMVNILEEKDYVAKSLKDANKSDK